MVQSKGLIQVSIIIFKISIVKHVEYIICDIIISQRNIGAACNYD